MSSIVAVIDIGKSNKKVALYDSGLRCLAHREQPFPATPGPDGVLHEQIDAIWAWLSATLRELYQEQPFAGLAVTTHGATIACLDAADQLALPVVAYEHDLGAEGQAALDRAFYQCCGPATELQQETGGCDLPLLINPAKALLFYRQQYPEGFARTTRIVNYPQFWGHLLTGQHAAEPTYAFNHSLLHDIRSRGPSRAARALGCADLLPQRFARPWDRLGLLRSSLQAELGLPPLPVAVGIHDSNAALLPYLLCFAGQPFVLNSTGTWCVAMRALGPGQEPRYAPEELGQKVIFNIDALDGLQKVSFLMGGQEYARYSALIGGECGGPDAARIDASLSRREAILPGAFPSQFPGLAGGAIAGERTFSLAELDAGQRPDWFADPALAHDLLIASIALQSRVALRRTGLAPGDDICVEGGFRNNPIYLGLLAALLPEHRIACTDLSQATSVGAALLAQAMVAGGHPADFAKGLAISRQPVQPLALPQLEGYAAWFLEQLGRASS